MSKEIIDHLAEAIWDEAKMHTMPFDSLMDVDKEPYRDEARAALKALNKKGYVIFEKDSVEASVGLIECISTMWGQHPLEDIAEEAWKAAVLHGAIDLNEA